MSKTEVSPDAEAIEQARGVLVRYRGDIATWQYGDLVGDIATALTAATMRERKACAEIAESENEEIPAPHHYSGICMIEHAKRIADKIRARSAQSKEGK